MVTACLGGVGLAPPAHGGAVLRERVGVGVLAGVHHDHQVPREVPADRAAGRRLVRLPAQRQQVLVEEGWLRAPA